MLQRAGFVGPEPFRLDAEKGRRAHARGATAHARAAPPNVPHQAGPVRDVQLDARQPLSSYFAPCLHPPVPLPSPSLPRLPHLRPYPKHSHPHPTLTPPSHHPHTTLALTLSLRRHLLAGVLPVSLFASGHTFFVTRMAHLMHTQPYMVLTNFQLETST